MSQLFERPSLIVPLAAVVCAALYSPATATNSDLIDPAEIDRAVVSFTGAPIGTTGGARAPADRRLRLAACGQALLTEWHGTSQSAVRVECPGPTPWRIFVATRPATQSLAARAQAPQTPQIKRGDPITVVVRGRGFTVQQAGEAMENGRVGDWIGIRTARKAEPVRARIERPGLAVIPVN